MTDFNIRHLVREVLRTSALADPGDVAAEVMKRIPEDQIRTALEQVLRDVVRNVMGEERASSRTNSPAPLAQSAPRLAPVFSPANPKLIRGEGQKPARSAKVAAIRDGWQKRLRDRVHVGASQWKLLGSCTYEDLLFAATERRGIADKNSAMARQYDAWARLLNEYEVATFGELPAETQMQALGVAA